MERLITAARHRSCFAKNSESVIWIRSRKIPLGDPIHLTIGVLSLKKPFHPDPETRLNRARAQNSGEWRASSLRFNSKGKRPWQSLLCHYSVPPRRMFNKQMTRGLVMTYPSPPHPPVFETLFNVSENSPRIRHRKTIGVRYPRFW